MRYGAGGVGGLLCAAAVTKKDDRNSPGTVLHSCMYSQSTIASIPEESDRYLMAVAADTCNKVCETNKIFVKLLFLWFYSILFFHSELII